MRVKDNLVAFIKARIPGIHLRTLEEDRAIEALRSTIQETNKGKDQRVLQRWSAPSGLWRLETEGEEPLDVNIETSIGFDEVLKAFSASSKNQNIVLTLMDPWDELNRPVYQRCLKEALLETRGTGSTIILVGRDWAIPAELQADIMICDLPLPVYTDLLEYIESLATLYAEKMAGMVKIQKESIPDLARACSGLTLNEAKSIVSLSLVRFKGIGPDAIKMAIGEKKQIVARTGLLEYEEADSTLSDVGGLVNLKNWLNKRVSLSSLAAAKAGIKAPKGVLLVGLPGCGKSLVAKSISAAWNQPLVSLDAGKLFGSLVGQSESNLRSALRTAEAVSPCILMIDEIEKGFGTSESGDAGTSQRVFGTLLTWMQNKKYPVFIIATANNIDKLDSALIRRFDAVFAVDLPDEKSRTEILNIHLRKAGHIWKTETLLALSKKCIGFTGSEIENVVQTGLIDTFNTGTKLFETDLISAIKSTVPLSSTMKDSMDKLREFCKSGRAIQADSPIEKDAIVNKKSFGIDL